MASKGIIAARMAQAAESQAKLLVLLNAKIDLLLKANKIEFDEAAFFGETPVIEEAAPDGTGQSEDNPSENIGGETTSTDGVKAAEEVAAPKGKK